MKKILLLLLPFTLFGNEQTKIVALESWSNVVAGTTYIIVETRPNSNLWFLRKLDGTNVGWKTSRGEGEKWRYFEDEEPEEPEEPETPFGRLFTDDDIGRSVLIFLQESSNPQLPSTEVNITGSIRRLLPFTTNEKTDAELYSGEIINYLDMGRLWRFTDSGSEGNHPDTGTYTKSYYYISPTPTGVKTVVELKATFDIRFFNGKEKYGNNWGGIYPYPIQPAYESQVKQLEIGRVWGWQDWKPHQYEDGKYYRIQTVMTPTQLLSPDNSFGFSDSFNRTNLLSYRSMNDQGRELREKSTIYQGGESSRFVIYLVLEEQSFNTDGKMTGASTQYIPYWYNVGWSYDGSKLL